MAESNGRVWIVVLGDIGHSPRMTYHALSLASHNFHVNFIGYRGSRPHESLMINDRVNLHFMDDVPNFGKYLPRIFTYALKLLWQSIILLNVFLWLPKPSHIIVQNPPSVPTLAIVWFYCLMRKCTYIIDWHNYGFTILSLTLGPNHVIVKICKWFEGYFGSKANYHLCVTNALRNDLNIRWKIRATVLYDRPSAIFRPIPLNEKHNLFFKLKHEYSEFCAKNNTRNLNETIITIMNGENAMLKDDRPAILTSGTSWTEDEDFNILIDALQKYDDIAADPHSLLPNLLCVITGKGPLKSHYENLIAQKNFSRIVIVLPWLCAEDYPKLLASADIGVSLHKSSSHLDLPMKVVDMFGCCLPVCAFEYPCISELVIHEKNGLLFRDSDELADQLTLLLKNFPQNNCLMNGFRENLKNSFNKLKWDQCWDENALQIFQT